jgi:hypothetical protein
MYINPDVLTEEDIKKFRDEHLGDRNSRPYVNVNDTEGASRFADVTIATSAYDNMILRARRTLGEYSLGSAQGVLRLCDDDNPDRYHFELTAHDYTDLMALHRAVLIGSIPPDVSYEGEQTEDPAEVKLGKVRQLVREYFHPEDLNRPVHGDIMMMYDALAVILKL